MIDVLGVRGCAESVRNELIQKYGDALQNCDREAADMLVKSVADLNLFATAHQGWCLYDFCNRTILEPCEPHWYVLVHDARERIYADCTATSLQKYLKEPIPEIIMMPHGKRPYWFYAKKPAKKAMRNVVRI